MGEGGYKQINKTLNVCMFEDYLATQQAQLPQLPDVEQITPRVIRILGQNAGKFTLQGTNTYIVGTGSKRLIIDTAQGFRSWADMVAGTLEGRDFDLSHVLLTHWHGDHTRGVPDLIRLYPSLSESIYKNSPEEGQLPIVDGETFRVEGATIRAVHGAGHSHDHTCFILEEENAMFTGDNVLGHGTSAVEELGTYMNTLEMLKSHSCATGYPAHGDVIAHLPSKIDNELALRKRRERQCLMALTNAKLGSNTVTRRPGAVTIPELAVNIHGDDVGDEIRKKALEPFLDEVLRKLSEDGRVAWQMRGGIKRWFAIEQAGLDAGNSGTQLRRMDTTPEMTRVAAGHVATH